MPRLARFASVSCVLFSSLFALSGCGGGDSSSSGGGAGGATSTGGSGGTGASGGDTTTTEGGTGGAGGDTTTSTTSTSTTTTDTAPTYETADALFNLDGIADIELTIPELSQVQLQNDPYSYVHGDMVVHLVNGESYSLPDVGLHLKGVYGSFRTLDQKAAFLVKTDKYHKKQELLGLTKLAINNMVQDPSFIHERIGYELFHGMNIASPRSGYARVKVNGQLYGLYATVEHSDNHVLLKHWYGDDTGSLYEGAYGVDLYQGSFLQFDQDNGADVGYADLQDFVNALDGMNDPDTFLSDVGQLIDFQRYTDFAATELFMGHWDGYASYENNYLIYRGPDMRWAFQPWGIDQTFSDYLDLWGGNGRVEQMCLGSLACRMQLKDSFQKVIAKVTELGLVARVDQLQALLSSAIDQDPRKEVDSGTALAYMGYTRDFLLGRPNDVTNRLVCADPTGIDNDGDGASGCGFDCDDNNPNKYPGAPEVCNLQDDNCNGQVDEDPMCPGCVNQPKPGGGTLAFCFHATDYNSAEADCVSQGGHLLSIHDQATQDAAWAGASSTAGGQWWIGVNDQSAEGVYVWTDGTPLNFLDWNAGEPNNAGDSEDCGHLADWAGGLWNDIPCGDPQNYICELP
ncbi:MAG: CotH kinase family protein [Polyangiaceae bacterium]